MKDLIFKQTKVPRKLNIMVLGKSGTLETSAGNLVPRVLSLSSSRKKEEKGRESTLGTRLVCWVLIWPFKKYQPVRYQIFLLSNWFDKALPVAFCHILVLGTTVLVHGDAGTDATLQVTSLVQVLLDPSCRTAKGWAELLSKFHCLYYRLRNIWNVIGNDQSCFSQIWNTFMFKLQFPW